MKSTKIILGTLLLVAAVAGVTTSGRAEGVSPLPYSARATPVIGGSNLAIPALKGWGAFWDCWWGKNLEGNDKNFTSGCWDMHMGGSARLTSNQEAEIGNVITELRSERKKLKARYEPRLRPLLVVEGESTAAKGWGDFWKCWWDEDLEGDDKSFTKGCWEKHMSGTSAARQRASNLGKINRTVSQLRSERDKLKRQYGERLRSIVRAQ